MNSRTGLAGCGLAIALTLSYTWELLAPAHIDGFYLRALPVASVAGGTALLLVLASALAWAILAGFQRMDPEGGSLLWLVPVAVVPAVVLRLVITLAELTVHVPSTLVLILLLTTPSVLLWHWWPSAWRKVVQVVLWGYVCVGVSIFWILPQLLMESFHHQAPEMRGFENRPTQVQSGQMRLVWVLLDELSYDQAFDHRQVGVALPALDALRATSFNFAAVQPTGYYTDQIVPALLMGRHVQAIRSTPDGMLNFREPGNREWQRFDPESSLFADAQRMGWSTAVSGWFNPYCRLLQSTLDSCYWTPETQLFPGHMRPNYTIWQNMLAPFSSKFHHKAEQSLAAEHAAAFVDLRARALAQAADPAYRFVFLHLPVPHPPAIFHRANGQLSAGGSYQDNLVLADWTVAEIRAAIAASPEAATTVLIVSSDHSLRVPKWRGGLYWSAEDERTLGARFDPRPVLLVHFPGQSGPMEQQDSFDELQTHTLVEELIQGRVHDVDTLHAWLRALRAAGQ